MVRYKFLNSVFFLFCAYADESWENPVVFPVPENKSPEEEAKSLNIPFKRLYPADGRSVDTFFLRNLDFLIQHASVPEDPEKKFDFVFCVVCQRWNKVCLPKKFVGSVDCSSCGDTKIQIAWL